LKKLLIAISFLIFYSLINAHSEHKIISNIDSLAYNVIIKYCSDHQITKIDKIPYTIAYTVNQIKSDSQKTYEFLNYFVDRLNESDSSKFYIKEKDYSFIKHQILYPKTSKYQKRKLGHLKFKRSLFGINSIALSIPIFTLDLKTAIFIRSCNGIKTCIMYKLNEFNNWVFVTEIFRDGTQTLSILKTLKFNLDYIYLSTLLTM